MQFKTADLCDEFSSELLIADPGFNDYGGKTTFCGQIVTVKIFEDNVLVRNNFEKPGKNQVLVVDGGGSMRCALVGDQLAELAAKNEWSGAVVNGCIRDSADIANINIGLKALNTHPLKSIKKGQGDENIAVKFAGIYFTPGDYLYADQDGIVIAKRDLLK